MDVIIFGGQSNMQGQTECLSENKVVDDAVEYKYLSDSTVPLCNPVGENIRFDGKEGVFYTDDVDQSTWLNDHVLGGACYRHTNMVPEFCRKYIDVTGRKVMAIHAAKGSTEVSYWLPGTAGYEMLKNKAQAGIKKAEKFDGVENIYFVWLQGESDAVYRKSKEYYKENIIALMEALKKDLNVQKFGIIRVGKFTNDDRDWEIINAQNEVCSDNDGFLMLTEIATEINSIPEYMNPYVGGHYSAKGQELLGATAGKALGEYVKGIH